MALLTALGFEGLREWGGWTPVRCQFHGDKHASASYSPDQNRYKCFVCDISGDAYDVIEGVEKVDFGTAVQRVAELVGQGGVPLRGEPGTGGGPRRSRLPAAKGTADSRRKALQARGRGRRRG